MIVGKIDVGTEILVLIFKMEKMKKLSDGTDIPRVGLGTWKLNGKECADLVSKALDMGYRHIDTAEAYGNEKDIGKALKRSSVNRKDLFITSKVWTLDGLDYEKVIRSCNKSLKNLGLDYLDLYLLHWPIRSLNWEDIFRALKDLQDKGRIKSIGVSNFNINHLKDLFFILDKFNLKVVINQVEFHPMLYQKRLLNFCKKNQIEVTAYSPLARGKMVDNDIVKRFSEKYAKTEGQIVLRWALQKDVVVIPKSSSEKHLRENISLFDFELSEGDEVKIDELNKGHREVNPIFADFNY